MTGVGKRERKYIRDRMDTPHCGNTFDTKLTHRRVFPKDDLRLHSLPKYNQPLLPQYLRKRHLITHSPF